MKKIMTWVLALALALSLAGACAEAEPFDFATLAGLEWSFSSGAGAWSTDMRILADGSFSGEFHDSDMGDCANDYPNGTVYCCSFTGRMSAAGRAGESAWMIRVDELRTEKPAGEVTIEDGIRFVTMDVYGLSEGDTMVLYQPGTPTEGMTEDMLFWSHLMDLENDSTELNCWFLYSEQNEAGFVGETPVNTVAIPNPWEDLSADQLAEATGLTFAVPDGAENVIYRYMRSEGLAEMQFTLNGGDYCARVLPAALEEGQVMNISGIYYQWEHEEAVNVGRCAGTLSSAQADSEDWVELCQWYDAAPGLMYSLSVVAPDLDGLDLAALAEQIWVPVQGNV